MLLHLHVRGVKANIRVSKTFDRGSSPCVHAKFCLQEGEILKLFEIFNSRSNVSWIHDGNTSYGIFFVDEKKICGEHRDAPNAKFCITGRRTNCIEKNEAVFSDVWKCG